MKKRSKPRCQNSVPKDKGEGVQGCEEVKPTRKNPWKQMKLAKMKERWLK